MDRRMGDGETDGRTDVYLVERTRDEGRAVNKIEDGRSRERV